MTVNRDEQQLLLIFSIPCTARSCSSVVQRALIFWFDYKFKKRFPNEDMKTDIFPCLCYPTQLWKNTWTSLRVFIGFWLVTTGKDVIRVMLRTSWIMTTWILMSTIYWILLSIKPLLRALQGLQIKQAVHLSRNDQESQRPADWNSQYPTDEQVNHLMEEQV